MRPNIVNTGGDKVKVLITNWNKNNQLKKEKQAGGNNRKCPKFRTISS